MNSQLPAKLSGFVLFLLFVVGSVASVSAGPVELLPGRWSGWGKMTLDGGEVEKMKCVATYFSEGGGRELRHNMRCASTNYRIDAKALLSVQSGKVSGNWEERNYSTSGAVDGAVVGDAIDVSIVGEAFKASLKIQTKKCTQTVTIKPKGLGIARIAVDLAKC